MSLGMQPTPAAITLARQRLGWQVIGCAAEEAAGPLAGQEDGPAFCAGMRLVAIDGLCLDLPDTPGNAAEFGYPGNGTGRGPFPQIRVVGAGECGTRAVLGAELSPLATGEQALARQLLTRLRPGDLLAADRNFLSHGLLAEVLAASVHVLWRAKSDVDLPVLEVLADGTWLSRIADPAASRKMRRRGTGPQHPGIAVRVIEYTVKAKTARRPQRPSPWSPTSPIPCCCPRSKPPPRTPPAGSWKPASMSWKPRSAAGPPSCCGRSPRP